MSLRRKLADSPRLNGAVEGLLAGYIRFACATSRWRREGFEEMDATVAAGEPVIFCLWHQRLVLAPYMFDTRLGRFTSLTSASRAGKLVGRLLARFGFETVPMSTNQRHVVLSREVLRRIAGGSSIGIAVDGPSGPARIASTVPLVWARSSGKPVYTVAWSANRWIRLGSWDRLVLPLPFSRGTMLCRKWDRTVPRRAGEAEAEALRLDLQDALDGVTDAADRAAGRVPDRT